MERSKAIRDWAAAGTLAALVFLAFGGALACGFVWFDDPSYVIDNARIADGWTAEGIRWAFTTGEQANWHPLTWLSHMADVELYGLEPAGHHFTSLLLHALNAILLFFALRGLTGRARLAWLVAALWAVHPLRAESVVWISERKDVLAMFFGLLALWAYGRNAPGGGTRPTVGKAGVGAPGYRTSRMALVALCFALSLMSKPLMVTLPFLLLLVDGWPLRRWPDTSAWKLVREKWALFLLAAISCVVTYVVQQAGGAVRSMQQYPLEIRLGNAAVAAMDYVRLLAWPEALSVFVPHPGTGLSTGLAWGCAAILILLTAVAVVSARRAPWATTGWLWYAGALVPMIGLVQVGGAARADRYTYLPHIGLIVALVWGIFEARPQMYCRPGPLTGRNAPGEGTRPTMGFIVGLWVLAIAIILALVLLSRQQTAIWRDSETLFGHALAVQEDNALAHANLGAFYVTRERPEDALAHLLRSLEIHEGNGIVHGSLGGLYADQGRPEDALRHLLRSLELQEENALAHGNLGSLYAAEGRLEEARRHLLRSLVIQPRRNGSNFNLANLYLKQGRTEDAIRHYRATVEDDPKHAQALNNLAWILASDPAATPAQVDEALAFARQSLACAPAPDASRLDTLAVAQAAAGDFPAAAATAREALAKVPAGGEGDALREGLRARLRAYEAGQKEEAPPAKPRLDGAGFEPALGRMKSA